ncbi:hypothetical protein I6E68_12205 [Salinibacterium sp. NSLL150]|nr:hypothetical protein [Salinibacterium sp. NSLL35]MBH0102651.1 hypothetical protein [Salinibacterium sp. NSLL150]MBH0105411.1 hypothetical protein [Salinibacterium sp. NSLL16]MBH0108171.1 hypothetical protein [Salinibacterium sp. NSLL17]
MAATATPARPHVRVLRPLVIELLWLLGALGLALLVVTYLAGTPGRGELMFLDGDSMIVPLFSRSILEGTASNWAMSAVLFVPEVTAFLVLSLLGWDIHEAQFLSAVANFAGLYLVFRVAAVTVAKGNRAALAATAGFAAVCILASTESAGNGDSPELASLLAVTTYYAATVLGVLLAVGITRRIVASSSPRRILVIALFAIAAVSVVTNPLYLAWATAPLVLIVIIVCAGAGRGRSALWSIVALVGGSALGYLLRIPLAPWIVANPDNYFQPHRSRASFGYYWALLLERLSSPGGVLAVAIVVALTLLGVWLTLRSLRHGAIGSAVVAAYSWFAPVATTVGFILLGTEASRYLQLWAFAPALALVVLIADARRAAPTETPWRRLVAFAAIPALLGGVTFIAVLPAAAQRATEHDTSLDCAVDWVNASGAVGAGQFWSVRAVKTHVDDQAQLIQTDFALRDYAWLVDRSDFDQHEVSFLIVDDQSAPFTLPAAAENLPSTTIDCGRFQIFDYSPASITRP